MSLDRYGVYKTYDDFMEAVKSEFPHKRIYVDDVLAQEGVVLLTIKYSDTIVEINATATKDENGLATENVAELTNDWQISSWEKKPRENY